MPEILRQVYVVEDDEDIRASLRLLLEDAAYHVEEAADGMAALAFLERNEQPWVVLLDNVMPSLDGIGVLEALAARPQVAERLAIIFLSARRPTFNEQKKRLLAEGTFAQVAKPFDLDELLLLIEQASQHLMARLTTSGNSP